MTLLLNGVLGDDSEDSLLQRLDDRALERVAREAPVPDEEPEPQSGALEPTLCDQPSVPTLVSDSAANGRAAGDGNDAKTAGDVYWASSPKLAAARSIVILELTTALSAVRGIFVRLVKAFGGKSTNKSAC